MDRHTVILHRDELYEAVWRQPVERLAAGYGISGPALAKICHKLNVPVPPRGHWAKAAAGTARRRPPLPQLRPGQASQHVIQAFRTHTAPPLGSDHGRIWLLLIPLALAAAAYARVLDGPFQFDARHGRELRVGPYLRGRRPRAAPAGSIRPWRRSRSLVHCRPGARVELVNFSVQDFRSITKAHRLRIGKQTVLIGPNNEGKSNLLRALVLALRMLEAIRFRMVYRGRSRPESRFYVTRGETRFDYDWQRDFPVHLQQEKPDGSSVFMLEFTLSPEEVEEFWTEVGSRLNGTLPVEVSLGREQLIFKVPKKGPGGKALSVKRAEIATFVSKRINFEYIRAIRTADAAEAVVEQMVARELEAVEQDGQFKAALKLITKLQAPLLEKLSKSIKETLSVFLPEVKDVQVRIAEEKRHRALRQSCEILVDDGTLTELRYKGDGIQSLAALSLMRHASESGSRGKNLLIAIEEPESHLHPHAIHQLRAVLRDLASRHRLVVTTHCPLLVDRVCVENNIIVTGNRAKHAASVEEIRRMLGVRAADNLQHAELVLVVEGDDDKKALSVLLAKRSRVVAQALQNGALAIESLGGGSNLAYKLGMLHDALCLTHAFMDNDAAGVQAAERAREEGLLPDAELHFAICRGLRESELEDLYDSSLYEQMFKSEYSVSIDVPAFRSKDKWSDRVSEVFRTQGKRWDARVEMDVKARIAGLVAERPDAALCPHKESVVEALKTALEERLATLHTSSSKTKREPPPQSSPAAA